MPIIQKLREPETYEIDIHNDQGTKSIVRTRLRTINYILKKMSNGYSPIIVITGEQRIGKSYFAVWLAYLICSAFRKKFIMERHVVYEPKKMLNKISALNTEPFILDESSYAYYYKEWYQKTHIIFSKILITQGRKVLCYIFVTPKEEDIDKSFIRHFHLKFKVIRRGFAKVFYIYKRKSLKEPGIHMDDIRLDLGDYPKSLWDDVDVFSETEKDKIEKELTKQNKEEKINIKQILRRFG